MDKHTIIGLLIIFAMFLGYSFYSSHKAQEAREKQLAEQELQADKKAKRDTTKYVQLAADSLTASRISLFVSLITPFFSILASIGAKEARILRIDTKASMIRTEGSIVTGEFRTEANIAIPCSANTYGAYLAPPRFLL